MLGRGIVTVLACSLVFTAGAAAQSNRPDPDSPAGVEYELPLDQTRQDLSGDGPGRGDRGSGGGGGGSESAGGSGAAPLFGAGISRAASSGGGSEEGGNPSGSGGSNSDDRAAQGGADGSTDGDKADPAVSKAGTGDGGGTGLLIPGLVLLVVLAGGAMGLLLRRGLGGAGSS